MSRTTTGFEKAIALAGDEVVTHVYAQDIALSNGATLVLLTLDNGLDHKRPNTLGPRSVAALGERLDEVARRADSGEIAAVAVTGKPYIFAAGADLSLVGEVTEREAAGEFARLGHAVFSRLHDLPVPSFAFLNGLALGGGLEIGLHCDYRTMDAHAAGIGLPEVFLGLIPGWGGSFLLPELIGIVGALRVIVENPLANNRMLTAEQARSMGVVDAVFDSARYLEDSLHWADEIVSGRLTVARREHRKGLKNAATWATALRVARNTLTERLGPAPRSPYVALDLLEAARTGSREEAFAREDEALADLVCGDQFRASIYAWNLVQKRAKKPQAAPDPELARPVTKVGIVGAGLMARQFALLFVRRLRVPIVLTDVDADHLRAARDYIDAEIDSLAEKGRIDQDECARLHGLIQTTTDYADFSDADWVIEAVFEELEVKQQVFAEVERHVSDAAVLATNTSSLPVTEMAHVLRHPERLVGFHFFNPVKVMPLVEVVRTGEADDAAIATALQLARSLRKNAVITRDTTGFVVNRVLARLLGEVMHAVETGTPFDVADTALEPFGLPMRTCALLELVGLTVAAHVLDTHAAAFPDRFHSSTKLHRLAEVGRIYSRNRHGAVTGFDKRAVRVVSGGSEPLDAATLRKRVEDALADEVHRMLAEKVVAGIEDIDLCMILGAGWPFQMGGVSCYLDRVGATERVVGSTFHTPPIRGVD